MTRPTWMRKSGERSVLAGKVIPQLVVVVVKPRASSDFQSREHMRCQFFLLFLLAEGGSSSLCYRENSSTSCNSAYFRVVKFKKTSDEQENILDNSYNRHIGHNAYFRLYFHAIQG